MTLYRKNDCLDCDQVEADLSALRQDIPHQVAVIVIDDHPELIKSFPVLPVMEAGPYRLVWPISQTDLRVALGAARDRKNRLEQSGDTAYAEKVRRGASMTGADKFTFWLSRHYMLVFNLFLALYVGLPWLAPIFDKAGWQGPASIVYTIYKPLCHQLAYRSWFLFGEQAVYPRQLAGLEGLQTYEQVTGLNPADTLAARIFIGDELLGFKMALCERDLAMYGSILLFGLLFSLTGNRLRHIPFLAWVLIGILPIALDGFSQLPGLLAVNVPAWLPIRESTPLLRTITGFLFGFTTGWYGFPIVEESMRDTRQLLARKIAVTTLH